MTTAEHYRKNWYLAWPVMIGQLGHVMVGLADSIMIGKIGVIPLAAAAFANSVFIIPMVFGIGMAFGLTTPVANADGRKEPLAVRSFLKHGLYLNAATAALLYAVLLVVIPLMPWMGQEQAVLTSAEPYYQIISASIFPLLLFLCFKQFAEGLGHTRVAMLISIGANGLNVGLNYLLIYGHFGFPALGLEGAGWATLIARWIMLLAMALYIFRHPLYRLYAQAIQWHKTEREHFLRIAAIGIPSGLQYIFEVSAFAIAAVMMGWLGAAELAAHQIAISLASVSYMMATGFGAAANVRVGNQLGARQFDNMRRAAKSIFVMTLIFMSLCGLLFYLGRESLPRYYTDDLMVSALAADFLLVAVFFQLADGLQVAVLGALRGLSETRIPTLITFITYWGIGLGASYGFCFWWGFGAIGIWFGLALGLTIASIALLWRFHYKARRYES